MPDRALPLTLIVKLCSAIVHADEALNSRTPHPADVTAFLSILGDEQVSTFLDSMRKQGYLPVKRS